MGNQEDNIRDSWEDIEENIEESFDTVTLYLDGDEELECMVLCIYEVEDSQYIALLPLDSSDGGDVLFYRYAEDENGEPSIGNIETDEEYTAAAEAFDELLEDEEFNEAGDEE